MAVKFTYLLGAGASAEALPLIKGMKGGRPGLPEELREFINSNRGKLTKPVDGTPIWETLLDIAVQCKIFGTPDLYAKFLIETGDDHRYKLLIRLLSNYFLFYQRNHNAGAAIVEGKFDRRALCAGTNILVIIGYSFPFFNRIIDDSLVEAMKATLEKIYFQDPFLDGSQLAAQFNLSDRLQSKIVHIPNTENYYIPFEL